MKETLESGKKNPLNFRLDFGLYRQNLGPQFFLSVLPVLDFRNSCKLSLHATSRKTKETNLRKWQKT